MIVSHVKKFSSIVGFVILLIFLMMTLEKIIEVQSEIGFIVDNLEIPFNERWTNAIALKMRF